MARKKDYRPFADARAFVRDLHLQTRDEWRQYAKTPAKPTDIPANPRGVYSRDFKGMSDWLGNGRITTVTRSWRPFEEARAFARSLRLKSIAEWTVYAASAEKPEDIPTTPRTVYASDFAGMRDWLGMPKRRQFRPFVEARAFVRGLRLQNRTQWREYAKSSAKPADIPASQRTLELVYGNDFQGMDDWLGTHYRKFRPFSEARAFVQQLKFRTWADWKAYCKSGKRPRDIPRDPRKIYGGEFRGMRDWLGLAHTPRFRSFADARAFVQTLRLTTYADWKAYAKSDNKPRDIPSSPERAYPEEFIGIGDWLGTGRVAASKQTYRSFSDARSYVRDLKLTSEKEWKEYLKSGAKPADIPARPKIVYPR